MTWHILRRGDKAEGEFRNPELPWLLSEFGKEQAQKLRDYFKN